MQLTVGTIIEGKVSKITSFGAFIDIDGGGSGMVHISEIANAYVKDINEHLTAGQQVRAKVVAINENNKIALSIKALLPTEPKPENGTHRNFSAGRPDAAAHRNTGRGNNTYVYTPRNNNPPSTGDNFEDMMNRFKKSSDDRMSDLSKVLDTRRGSNNRRSRNK